MEKWVGKVAVVTGASAGIGASIAINLANRGVIVAGFARRADKVKEIAKFSKGTIHSVKCDIKSEEDILHAFEWVENNLGGVDILVNNAAVCKMISLLDGDTEGYRSLVETNILGLTLCTREALKTMRKRGDNGHIFHINSVAGHHVPRITNLPIGMYSATKFAITSLTESLRVELQNQESNIKITSISPGYVYTDMVINILSLPNSEIMGVEPPEGFLGIQDIADAVIYALSTRPKVQVHEILLQPIGQKYS